MAPRRDWPLLSYDDRARDALSISAHLPNIAWPPHRALPAEKVMLYYDGFPEDLTPDEMDVLDNIAEANGLNVPGARAARLSVREEGENQKRDIPGKVVSAMASGGARVAGAAVGQVATQVHKMRTRRAPRPSPPKPTRGFSHPPRRSRQIAATVGLILAPGLVFFALASWGPWSGSWGYLLWSPETSSIFVFSEVAGLLAGILAARSIR